ncbi:MAG TPA: hypothetical protein VFT96_00545 [Gemmatimonadaceae bacterium]|nr:hypothetical protein [Gemmatimonadaceae bacterium]
MSCIATKSVITEPIAIRREKGVVRRVQRDAADRRDHEHHGEEEEQRDRREQGDLAREGAGLELLGHRHADLEA